MFHLEENFLYLRSDMESAYKDCAVNTEHLDSIIHDRYENYFIPQKYLCKKKKKVIDRAIYIQILGNIVVHNDIATNITRIVPLTASDCVSQILQQLKHVTLSNKLPS